MEGRFAQGNPGREKINLEGRLCSGHSSDSGVIPVSLKLMESIMDNVVKGFSLSLTESVNTNGILCFFASCVITNYITVVCVRWVRL